MTEEDRLDRLNEFKLFFAEHDRRREVDIRKAFPELNLIYEK